MAESTEVMPIVVIVEDNESVQTLLARAATKAGFKAVPVNSAEKGWNTIQVLRPYAVITDVQLPGMNGRELVKLCRARPELQGMRIAVMSGDIAATDEISADGDVHVFEKPFDMGAVVVLMTRGVD